jgi:hypothetical protein
MIGDGSISMMLRKTHIVGKSEVTMVVRRQEGTELSVPAVLGEAGGKMC